MMTAIGCVRCGTSIVPGQRYCATCGFAVPLACTSCGEPVGSDAHFCPRCGASAVVRAAPLTPTRGTADRADDDTQAAWPSEPHGPVTWGHVAAQLRYALRGEFAIEREIGRGGMAAVYLARELRLNRRVALKVMSPALLSDGAMVERFRQEAMISANLSHANIVTVHAVREVEDLHFLVMRYVEGRSLDHIHREQGTLPVSLLRTLVFDVASALAYAHRRGVVHRDVKPGNVLVDTEGRAVVTDFGIAKVAESSAHTQTGMLIGTPTYMSPEQCLGRTVSAASDQYSLGVMVYELLAGRAPFVGASLAVLQQHIASDVPPLRTLVDACPPDIDAALARMLAKDPALRWPGILQAAVALGGAPVHEDDPRRGTLATFVTAIVAAPPRPQTVRITLSDADLAVGDVAQASAEVLDQHGAVMTRVGVRWTSDAPDRLAVDDTTARVSALAPGHVTLRASAGEVSGVVTLDIAAPEPASLAVEAPPTPLRVAEVWRPVVAVYDRRGALMPTPVRVEALGPSIVHVTDDGLVEGERAGHVVVRFTAASLSHDVPLDVAPAAVVALTIEGALNDLTVGDQVRCTATAPNRRGHALPDACVAWRSSDPHIASVDAQGTVSARAFGATTLEATADGCTGRIAIRVRPVPVRTLVLAPPPAMRVGEHVALTAETRDARGREVVRPIRWTSSAPPIASVTAVGIVEAHQLGTAVITAECEGASTRVEIVVGVSSATELFQPVDRPPSPEVGPIADNSRVVAVTNQRDHAGDAAAWTSSTRESVDVDARSATASGETAPSQSDVRTPATPPMDGRGRTSRRVPLGIAGLVLLGGTAVSLRMRPAPTPAREARAGATVAAPQSAAANAGGRAPASQQSAIRQTSPTRADADTSRPALVTPPKVVGVDSTSRRTNSTPPAPARALNVGATRATAAKPTWSAGAASARGASGVASAEVIRRAPDSAPSQTPAKTPSQVSGSAPAAATAGANSGANPVTNPAPRAASEPTSGPGDAATVAEAAAAAESRAGMQRAIAAYVDAVNARNVRAMIRLFPSMPSATQRSWEGLFSTVPAVDAHATAIELDPKGSDAGSAQLSFSFTVMNPQNKQRCTQGSTLVLRLARSGGEWHIVELTQLGTSTRSAACG